MIVETFVQEVPAQLRALHAGPARATRVDPMSALRAE